MNGHDSASHPASWSPEAQEHFKALKNAADNLRAQPCGYVPEERSARATIVRIGRGKAHLVRRSVNRKRGFRLPNRVTAGGTRRSVSFKVEPIPGTGTGAWWLGAIWPAEDANPSVAIAGRSAIQISGTSGDARCQALSGGSSVAVADLNYDFRLDLAVAGSNGLCLLRRGEDSRFTDVTALTTLPPALLQSAAHAVWPADIDTDGDLALVLALRDGAPVVLRHNGDVTFAPREVFGGITRARPFVSADCHG